MKFIKFYEGFLRLFTRVLLPAFFAWLAWFGVTTYFEHDVAKTVVDAQVKIMCIQSKQCPDCNEI